jgi:hypothetical protein
VRLKKDQISREGNPGAGASALRCSDDIPRDQPRGELKWKAMEMLEVDANGNLTIPAEAPPGTRFAVERERASLTIRPASSSRESGWSTQTPEERRAWVQSFLADLPPGVGLRPEHLHREDMY